MNDGVIELTKELVNKFLAALSLILHNCRIFSKLTDYSMRANFKTFLLIFRNIIFFNKKFHFSFVIFEPRCNYISRKSKIFKQSQS